MFARNSLKLRVINAPLPTTLEFKLTKYLIFYKKVRKSRFSASYLLSQILLLILVTQIMAVAVRMLTNVIQIRVQPMKHVITILEDFFAIGNS